MLPQPVPATGAPLSRSDQVRQAARPRNTQRAYLGHWTRLAEDGKRMATIRQARAAIIKGAELAG